MEKKIHRFVVIETSFNKIVSNYVEYDDALFRKVQLQKLLPNNQYVIFDNVKRVNV